MFCDKLGGSSLLPAISGPRWSFEGTLRRSSKRPSRWSTARQSAVLYYVCSAAPIFHHRKYQINLLCANYLSIGLLTLHLVFLEIN